MTQASVYDIDEHDRLESLQSLPPCSPSVPLPIVFSDEQRTLIAYFVHGGEEFAIVEFPCLDTCMLGGANEEALNGHPLFARGLRSYGAFEVRNSSWIRRLERMNAAHPQHDRAEFLSWRRHFILTFHDSMFECIARDVRMVELLRGSRRDAVLRLAARFQERPAS